MTALILPRRLHTQPQGVAEVDWSHPALGGATAGSAEILLPQAARFVDVVNGVQVPRYTSASGATPISSASPVGVDTRIPYLSTNATNGFIKASPNLSPAGGYASLLWVLAYGCDSSNGNLGVIETTTAGDSFRQGFRINPSTLAFEAEVRAGSFDTATRSQATGTLPRRSGVVVCRFVAGASSRLDVFCDGALLGSHAGAGTANSLPSVPIKLMWAGNFMGGVGVALAAQIPNSNASLQDAADLSVNPWQLFRAQPRRIYFDLGAGGTTYNQALSVTSTGSASFARAMQAIKLASATSSAVTQRLIAIQRNAASSSTATATKQAQMSRAASSTGAANLTSIKSIMQAMTAGATGSASVQRLIGMARSVSSTGSATYSRTVALLRSVTSAATATLSMPSSTQFLRPDGNVTQTSFTGGFAEIDEATASDADFAYGANNTAAVLEVSLSNPDGTPGSGTTTVRYRIARTNAGTVDGGGNAVTVTAAVYQGTTLIAADSAQTATGTWTQYSWAPSMASVTDWNDLRLRFTTSASGGTAANRRGGAVSWGEIEAPAGGATIFEQALTATSTAAASFVRSIGRVASASASGAASFIRAVGKSASAAASGAASYLRDMSLSRSVTATATATVIASRALFATLTANATGTASLATAMAITMTLTAAAAGSATMTAMFGLLIAASATGSASIIRAISLTRAAASAAAAIVQRTVSVTISAASSVVALLMKLASTAGTSLARMLSISAESRIHTPSAENRIRTLGAEDRDLTE